jgi:hypothetical protein
MTANDDDGILIQPGDEGWTELCLASQVKRGHRATQDQMNCRRGALLALTQTLQPATVRQVFYQATIHRIVDKTENGYDKVQACLAELRLDGVMPFDWLVDNSRWMRKPRTYDNLEQMLRITAQTYRRSLWLNADCYVEMWLEKDALSGTILDITAEFDVPLMVARGYSSLTFLRESGDTIEMQEKPAFIYHLGDWDPSGQNAADNIELRLREFAPNIDISFTKLAVTREQITEWDLPTRPTKASDSRSVSWTGGDSVEVDAIHPDTLRALVRAAIEQHVDERQIAAIRTVEESEREILRHWRPSERAPPP